MEREKKNDIQTVSWRKRGGLLMTRWTLLVAIAFTWFSAALPNEARSQQAFGRAWGNRYSIHDWDRFYHYPYVYYPQNFWGNEYYRSAEDLYYRYPQEMRIPVYNRKWQNYYPQSRRYHQGHHFILDVF